MIMFLEPRVTSAVALGCAVVAIILSTLAVSTKRDDGPYVPLSVEERRMQVFQSCYTRIRNSVSIGVSADDARRIADACRRVTDSVMAEAPVPLD